MLMILLTTMTRWIRANSIYQKNQQSRWFNEQFSRLKFQNKIQSENVWRIILIFLRFCLLSCSSWFNNNLIIMTQVDQINFFNSMENLVVDGTIIMKILWKKLGRINFFTFTKSNKTLNAFIRSIFSKYHQFSSLWQCLTLLIYDINMLLALPTLVTCICRLVKEYWTPCLHENQTSFKHLDHLHWTSLQEDSKKITWRLYVPYFHVFTMRPVPEKSVLPF